jgi:excisionase family DNA binding protein
MMMGELWRVYRVAKLLDVSKKRVYQMVQEGKIDAVRLGPRSMRITRESIDIFVTTGRKKNREEIGVLEKPEIRRPRGRKTRFTGRVG